MKSLKLIESRNIDNDIAETLLPTLSNKKMNDVKGGLSCGLKYETEKLYCGAKFVEKNCSRYLSCGQIFISGPTTCREGYSTEEPCFFY